MIRLQKPAIRARPLNIEQGEVLRHILHKIIHLIRQTKNFEHYSPLLIFRLNGKTLLFTFDNFCAIVFSNDHPLCTHRV